MDSAASLCELGGCKFLPLCEACEQAEIIAATKHLTDPSVCSPLAERWGTVTLSGDGEVGVRGELPPPEIEAYIEQVLADVSGGSSSMTPGAGDATQGAKDGEPGTPSDSPPPTAASLHPVQQQALWLLLGNGLDEVGKVTWLACRFNEGKSVEEIFADALRQMDGMVAM